VASIMRNSISAALVGILVGSSAAPAIAATQISDLDGMRAGSLDGEMEGLGFTLHHQAPSGQGSYTYWWKAADKTCARVYTADGRVANTRLVSVSDCGQKSGDAGAAIAIGAAAIIGAIALSSKSHHRNDQYGEDPRQLAEFDRGHRDGLHNEAYHNYSNTPAYKSGYESGVRERDEQTRRRRSNRGWGGYSQFVELSDLTYQDSNWAIGQMQQRGFRRVAAYDIGGGGSNLTYYNQNSRQCVQLTTRDLKVQNVESINEGNCQ
jgi:hypothetical protein